MSRREDISTAFWDDPEIQALSPIARAVYLWSFSNRRCGMAGIYKVAMAALTVETGWTQEQATEALSELEDARYAYFDGRVMWVRTRVKHLRTHSWSIAKAIQNDLEALGEHPYVGLFREENADQAWLDDTARPPAKSVSTAGGESVDTPSTTSSSPLKGSHGTGTGKGKKEGGPGETPDRLPEDLATHLYGPALQVHAILTRIAAAKPGARPVTLAAVGRTIQAYPTHDVAQIAGDVEHWWCHGAGATKPIRDVVLTYRNRLGSLPAPPPTASASVHQISETTEQRRARMVAEARTRNARLGVGVES